MTAFWEEVDDLCGRAAHVVDRPAGSGHPRFCEWVYPVDYGYLEGTAGGDGSGIDVWFGSAVDGGVNALVCTIDPHKGDSEITYLWRCTPGEVEDVRSFYGEQETMKVLFVER